MKKKRKAVAGQGVPDGFVDLKKEAKSQRIWREVAPSKPIDDGFHTYKADPLDHAETDLRAYEHVKPFMHLLAKTLNKTISNLALWDPYYCKGAMVERLAKLGFNKVHNKNEDFYKVIESGKLPEHDVIISSPPYSGDHLERCLRFCNGSRKTWCLLLPNWVESRPYFKKILGEETSRVFYMAPVKRYTYWMPLDLVKGKHKPEWVGQDGGTSPYHSSWYIYLPKHLPRKKIVAALERMPSSQGEWVLAQTMKAARWKQKKAQPNFQPSGEEAPQMPTGIEALEVEDKRKYRPSGKKGGKNKKGKKRKNQSDAATDASPEPEGKRKKSKIRVMEGTITFE